MNVFLLLGVVAASSPLQDLSFADDILAEIDADPTSYFYGTDEADHGDVMKFYQTYSDADVFAEPIGAFFGGSSQIPLLARSTFPDILPRSPRKGPPAKPLGNREKRLLLYMMKNDPTVKPRDAFKVLKIKMGPTWHGNRGQVERFMRRISQFKTIGPCVFDVLKRDVSIITVVRETIERECGRYYNQQETKDLVAFYSDNSGTTMDETQYQLYLHMLTERLLTKRP